MSLWQHRCAYSVTTMGATAVALMDQRCHCNGCHWQRCCANTVTVMVPPPWHCYTNTVTMMDVTVTALLCHSVTVMDATMMAPLCQCCHHDGCHRHGTAVLTVSP